MTYKTFIFRNLTIASLFCIAIPVFAQSGAVNGTPMLLTPQNRPMTMREASTIFQAPQRPRMLDIDDIVYVHIKEKKTYNNTANNQRKKKIETSANLSAWTKVTGLFKMPVSVKGDSLPEIGGKIDHKTQNQGNLTRTEMLDFYIPCRVTDIRDNGNLVIDGNKSSNIGEEGCTITVSGIIRPDTIGPDLRVESNQVAELVIREIPSGNVFETVRRPWGTRLLEQLKPF